MFTFIFIFIFILMRGYSQSYMFRMSFVHPLVEIMLLNVFCLLTRLSFINYSGGERFNSVSLSDDSLFDRICIHLYTWILKSEQQDPGLVPSLYKSMDV